MSDAKTAPPVKSSAGALLDEMLPLAEPAAVEVHTQAAVLEVNEPAQLLELAADPLFQPFLLCRLAANVALVDPRGANELAEALRRRGHTPKLVNL